LKKKKSKSPKQPKTGGEFGDGEGTYSWKKVNPKMNPRENDR